MLVNQRLVSEVTKGEVTNLLIVDIDEVRGRIAVTDLNVIKPRRPYSVEIDFVEAKLKSGEWYLEDHEFPKQLYQSDSFYKERFLVKQLQHTQSQAKSKSRELIDPLALRDEAWSALKPLIEDPELLHRYFYGSSKGIVNELMELSGHNKKYITQHLNKYFYFGGINNSLLPKYYQCGTNFKLAEKPVVLNNGSYDLSGKTGPQTINGNVYRHVTQLDVNKIKQFVKHNVRNGHEVVAESLYAEFIADYCSVKIRPKGVPDDDVIEEFRMKLERKHLISPRAFKRQVNKLFSKLVWLKKKVGAKNYLRDHASKTGIAKHGLRGPTSRYEIDSTVLDIYVRYEFSNELLSIGRPILYIIIDVVTGMVVGMHVAFHGPDWTGASQALLNAFSDKVAFCKKYGLSIKEEDWPCHHVCRELTADRGSENSDRNMESILKGKIGISTVNLNAYHMGSAKGTVEKSFDTTQERALTFEAGKVEKYVRYEDKHASRRALLTHQDLMKSLIKAILHANNHVTRVNARTFEMERDGVQFTARDMWNYGLERSIIPAAKLSQEKLIFALLPEKDAVIRAQGVYFEGLFYSSKEFERLDLLDEAKNFGRKSIKIRYTDTSTNSVWWRDESTNQVYTLNLTDRSQAYKNLTWANILHRIKILKHELALAEEKSFMSAVLLRADLRTLEKAALRKTRKLKTSKAKSPAQGTKDRYEFTAQTQKAEYQQDMQGVFTSTGGTGFKTSFNISQSPTWGNPNAVPLEVNDGER
jgi:hypothetical protein